MDPIHAIGLPGYTMCRIRTDSVRYVIVEELGRATCLLCAEGVARQVERSVLGSPCGRLECRHPRDDHSYDGSCGAYIATGHQCPCAGYAAGTWGA